MPPSPRTEMPVDRAAAAADELSCCQKGHPAPSSCSPLLRGSRAGTPTAHSQRTPGAHGGPIMNVLLRAGLFCPQERVP